MVLTDFDGTVTKRDVCYLLLDEFAKFNWQETDRQWVDGRLSTEEAYKKLLKSIDITKEKFDRFIETVEIDEGFKAFFFGCKKNNVRVEIVSDGLDYYIRRILEREGLGEIPFHSNRLNFKGNEWVLEFDKKSHKLCPRKDNPCGFCKRMVVEARKNEGYKIIFIGDGPSDRCPASCADIVFAKGFLKEFCVENKISHYEFMDFNDVRRLFESHKFFVKR
ncbi:MAG: hypothetical protein A3C43_06410 [Candidatus Schekmanbacteria bacterium RIFCSPHIGHO2_02_FULL_38_11]|uniref:2,3-diketo-5-methylthio-1-phosphopentane phosphatase n=1 Tax=Candidatus Schekmanbacteria bacterium RIFCSPLOWO2_12_FULL_38_15 TaxID=1817883 RepID=A0A1F7SFC0_9BACT|nr:MAG: hypothetical protein A2043_08235 [Candidatus Schekmanbacteria bacterium GWA2_38_9]OGL48869.1 MAG: hypothetical protein A3C43_06410 [Candidatus Schekmanbacteria bacterium RIFCSPHIGHO2_02_FULL_38_11]OGL50619.1 MAG: hypothetical protein A3H37_02110 [Candidatus Schekmanbacteria bacterium RIFCSPLOWO2_02_FULL_38_14]OGL52483.1 MAG: hypothetical protein A3G31_10870 [Candidatus Schekmanbacteria bacterium RIFCSPLOWO2_12_FULL_38_15]